ncbi:MAG: hypothetical protein CML03_00885 [Pseudooceanicola sp.]|nr:hypothetical protein [Pseudooceanicola sp.]|tara:strand:- start:13373 stop:13846 length:474 start_codon:yes stop_codon:yes gene_type:complete
MVYYGLAKPSHTWDYARMVCDCLGHGDNRTAMAMLIETAAQETHCGQYRDPTPGGAGRGLCQIDQIAFEDIQRRTREANVGKVFERFNVNIQEVEHSALDNSPLLSMIFCRLFYMLIPEPFPIHVEGRAAYWKRYYNTSCGAGTEAEYIENAKRYTL